MAVDAESGLLTARVEVPDLILMDIQLPGDGWVRRYSPTEERPDYG
jgi:CheY-like chemotaxis protein